MVSWPPFRMAWRRFPRSAPSHAAAYSVAVPEPPSHTVSADHLTELANLTPAVAEMKRVLAGIGREALARPTPCTEFTVADLLEHISLVAKMLTAVALRDPSDRTKSAESGLRDAISALAADIDRLSVAWGNPQLLEVDTATVCGVTMPIAFYNMIAVQELVLHAWDLAAATGQVFHPDPGTLDKLHAFLAAVTTNLPYDRSDPFGPAISVSSDASVLDRVLGMSGRDPLWRTTN